MLYTHYKCSQRLICILICKVLIGESQEPISVGDTGYKELIICGGGGGITHVDGWTFSSLNVPLSLVKITLTLILPISNTTKMNFEQYFLYFATLHMLFFEYLSFLAVEPDSGKSL